MLEEMKTERNIEKKKTANRACDSGFACRIWGYE